MNDQRDINRDEALDEELTQLVSYLDGELDESQMTQVEQELADNNQMRSHADILSRTWSMLDSLEDVPVSDTFTQDTMATIQAEATESSGSTTTTKSSRQWLAFLSTYNVIPAFALGLIAGLLGLAIGGLVAGGRNAGRGGPPGEGRRPNNDMMLNDIVINNLEVLRNAGRYQEIPSAEQLREVELRDAVDPAVPSDPVPEPSSGELP
ncbi:MAG: hypothetical protein NXI04_09880 [Planctomycetaceae bacterium]|nr:hypothetical protein [Planctomycetaceae bacterium]